MILLLYIDLNDDVLHTLRTNRKLTENHTIEKDMSNCFGFGVS